MKGTANHQQLGFPLYRLRSDIDPHPPFALPPVLSAVASSRSFVLSLWRVFFISLASVALSLHARTSLKYVYAAANVSVTNGLGVRFSAGFEAISEHCGNDSGHKCR